MSISYHFSEGDLIKFVYSRDCTYENEHFHPSLHIFSELVIILSNFYLGSRCKLLVCLINKIKRFFTDVIVCNALISNHCNSKNNH